MSKNKSNKEQAAKASGSEDPGGLAGVMGAIASSEQKILARIDSCTNDLKADIDSIKNDIANQEARLQDVESGLSEYSDRTVALEGDVGQLKSEVAKLTQKIDDLEGRQRRCNARIIGVPEGLENTGNQKHTDAIATMLKGMLGLNFVPTLDRAHRGLRPPPGDGEPPRVIVVKFHYFQEREEVFRKAASSAHYFCTEKGSAFSPTILMRWREDGRHSRRLSVSSETAQASSLGSCSPQFSVLLHQQVRTSGSRTQRRQWITLRTLYNLKNIGGAVRRQTFFHTTT
ncbi:hypothetical protein WMY93_017248 [Mugilogobius chulae]|uniref:L1 transposable element RRM domain-containing protein n=1 Tax=Mugilogobius chulae TaxID=88201 RepID=A0AAW0NUR6_9GOBI